MSSKNAQTAVPKVRFPEFRDAPAFNKTKLNKLLFETKRRNRDLKYGKTDVLSVTGEYGCVNQIEFLGRSYAGVSVKDYHIVETGDIVYTKSPLKNNPYGIIKQNKGRPGIVSTLYAVYRTNKSCKPEFLGHYFSSDYNLNSYLQPLVNKGAKNDMKVKNSDVLKGEIFVPGPEEQQKIADCLTSVDEVIVLEKRKLEQLQHYKKGLMHQLFPAEDDPFPIFRFPEFRDAPKWEKKALKNVCEINPSNKELPEHFIYIDLESVVAGLLVLKKEIHVKDAPSRAQRLLKKGDVIYQVVRPYQRNNLFCKFDDDQYYVASTGYAQMRAFESEEFLYHVLYTDAFVNIAIANCSGTNYPAINSSDLAKIPVFLPKPEEQKRVAEFLSSVDELIYAQLRKIEVLQNHKKGLLQHLCPSVEEVSG